MRDTVKRRDQLALFLELTETVTTRDVVTENAVLIRPPPGRGWFVIDAHRERFTQWQRRRPVVLPRRRRWA
jgi:hypothetical protein